MLKPPYVSASPAGSMCDQRKIHVFLGAPPPACSPASEPGAGLEEDDRAPARWRHLELTWRNGQLRPAGETFRDQTGGRSTHCCFLLTELVSCKCAGSHRPWLSGKRVSVRTLCVSLWAAGNFSFKTHLLDLLIRITQEAESRTLL